MKSRSPGMGNDLQITDWNAFFQNSKKVLALIIKLSCPE